LKKTARTVLLEKPLSPLEASSGHALFFMVRAHFFPTTPFSFPYGQQLLFCVPNTKGFFFIIPSTYSLASLMKLLGRLSSGSPPAKNFLLDTPTFFAVPFPPKKTGLLGRVSSQERLLFSPLYSLSPFPCFLPFPDSWVRP